VAKAIAQMQQRKKEDSKPMYRQITETFEIKPESIWEEIDILVGDPGHRGMVMRNARFKPLWLTAEVSEWEGLWDKGVFKKWKRSVLLEMETFSSSEERSCLYEQIRLQNQTISQNRCRLSLQDTSYCMRFQDEERKGLVQNFSPTPGIVIVRIITSIGASNDLELHSIDIEQVFLQTDKLMEGVNDRYFINPPPGNPDANNKDIVYEVLRPLYGIPSSSRDLHETM